LGDSVNIERIRRVHNALEELSSTMAYVGGATVSLYRDRPAADARFTQDVDLVVELATYRDFADLEDSLRKKGFVNDIGSGVLCRYTIGSITVDFMPTRGDVLGFSNPWYPSGFAHSITYRIDESTDIRIFDAPHFLATKLAAFHSRGRGDGRTSSDFEDIVYVLKNRHSIWDEMSRAPMPVRNFLQTSFAELLAIRHVFEWFSVHMDPYERQMTDSIIRGLSRFCNQ
jgi:predicted nucleotidyltransferase